MSTLFTTVNFSLNNFFFSFTKNVISWVLYLRQAKLLQHYNLDSIDSFCLFISLKYCASQWFLGIGMHLNRSFQKTLNQNACSLQTFYSMLSSLFIFHQTCWANDNIQDARSAHIKLLSNSCTHGRSYTDIFRKHLAKVFHSRSHHWNEYGRHTSCIGRWKLIFIQELSSVYRKW